MAKGAKSACYYCGIPAIVIFWLFYGNYQRTQRYAENRFNCSLREHFEDSLDSRRVPCPSILAASVEHLLATKAANLTHKRRFSRSYSGGHKTLKTILMWSNWDKLFSDGVLAEAQCPVTSCLFTSDVTLLNQSDVVVFYIDTSTNFPLNREPHQRFVFFNLEPPYYSSHKKISDPRVRYGYFNWTMTYRWDSDIVFRSNYGFMVKKDAKYSKENSKTLRGWSFQIDGKNSSSTHRSADVEINNRFLKQVTKKKRLIAWFVSNCFAPSRREKYVEQLSQYVPIDIFGTCTMRNCSHHCEDMLRFDYKFYLAFENSFCPEYVTEKFYRALQYDTVPIVLGGADYNHFAPQHSYINIRDFRSPKELAEYLLLLNQSDALYSSYFQWKQNYQVIMPDNYGLCDLCSMAHNESLPNKIYKDIKRWWFEEKKCTYQF